MLITANSVFKAVLGEQFFFYLWYVGQCVDYANIWKPVSACIQSFSTGMKLVDGNLARLDWVS